MYMYVSFEAEIVVIIQQFPKITKKYDYEVINDNLMQPKHCVSLEL